MRALFCGILLVGCSGSDEAEPNGTETDDSDSGVVDSIVPDEYKFLWNTEGSCTTEFGAGNQMYMLFEGHLAADGTLEGTERVWWFYKDKGPEADCVDTFTLRGTVRTGDPSSQGCASCELFYDTRRTLTEDNCREKYGLVYRTDDAGLYQTLMMDTLNELNDQPNENNKVGVFHQEKQWGQENYITKLYASESGSALSPESEDYAPPAGLKWHGKRCQLKFGR
jgi:hypothetical protein